MDKVWWLAGAAIVVGLSRGLGAAGLGSDTADAWTGSVVMFSSKVRNFAHAIAVAEGFYSNGATLPKRNHNPGDLKASSVPSIGASLNGELIFARDADGWEALHRQLQLIIDGRSRVYSLDMTIADMAGRYAEGAVNWAANVSSQLNVTAGTTLRELLT